MISLYLLCFILLVAGTFLILELTPETVTDDIMHMVVPEQTLRDKVLIAQKKKKSRKIMDRSRSNRQKKQAPIVEYLKIRRLCSLFRKE